MKIVSANITGSFILNGVDLTTTVESSSIWSGSIANRVSNLEQFSSSLDATFATDAQLYGVSASFQAYTSSNNNTTASILNATASIYNFSSSILSYTSSTDNKIAQLNRETASLNLATASFNNATASLYAATASLYNATSSINTYTASNNASIADIRVATASLYATTASINSYTASNNASIADIRNTTASLYAATASLYAATASIYNATASLYATTASLNQYTRSLNLNSSSFATTGSNTFVGAQNFSNASNAISFTSTGSLYSDGGMRITRDMYVSGTAFFNNVTVFGTQSINYISSSQLNIASNIISVNTATPTVRFGGLAVYDSGSLGTGLTGSILWDSEDNQWIYSNPSGSTYDSSVFLVGPRSTGPLGNEVGITINSLAKGDGAHHMTSSAIFDVSGSVGIGTTSPSSKLHVSNTAAATRITLTDDVLNGRSGYIESNYSDALVIGTTSGVRSIKFAPDNSTKMVIEVGSGNVGIGTTSPGVQLTVNTTANSSQDVYVPALKLHNEGNSANSGYGVGIEFQMSNDYQDYKKAEIRAIASSNYSNTIDLTFWSGGSSAGVHAERMRVTSAGNVGIGTTSPAVKLDVNGEIRSTSTSGYAALLSSTALGYSILADTHTGGAMTIWTSGSEKMRVTSAGNVGIGTSSPVTNASYNKVLHINSTSGLGAVLKLTDTTTGTDAADGFELLQYGVDSYLLNRENGKMLFYTNNNPRMVIDSVGNVGIGTTSPSGKLDISGSADYNTLWLRAPNGNVAINFDVETSATQYYNWRIDAQGLVGNAMSFSPSSAPGGTSFTSSVMTLTQGGNIGIGTTSPDARLNIYNSTTEGKYLNVDALAGFAGIGSGSGAMITFNNKGDGNNVLIRTANSARTDAAPFAVWTENNSRFIILNNGSVGIGTTSPQTHLDVVSSTHTKLRVRTTAVADASVEILGFDAGVHIGDPTNGNRWVIWNDGASTSSSLKFGSYALGTWYTDAAQAITITSAGNVGIGTTSPGAKLQVYGNLQLYSGTAGYSDPLVFGSETGSPKKAIFLENYWMVYQGHDNEGHKFRSVAAGGGYTDDMTITGGGNVGIGTTSPSSKLHVSSGRITITAASSGQYDLIRLENNSSSANGAIGVNSSGFMYLSNTTGGTQHFVLDSNGNVGIGTTSPSQKLQVSGDLLLGASQGVIYKSGYVAASNIQNTWYSVHTFGIYELTAFILLVGYEQNSGDGSNLTAVFVDAGSNSYGTGFSTSRLTGSTSIEAQRSSDTLQIRVTASSAASGSPVLRWTLIKLNGD